MRLSTGFITAAYGAKVLAADATDYLGQLTDLYESYGTDAVNSIADLYQTDNSFFCNNIRRLQKTLLISHGILTLCKSLMRLKLLKSLVSCGSPHMKIGQVP